MASQKRPGTLVLTRSEVARLLDLDRCIEAVEEAFRAHGDGSAADPAVLGVHLPGGGFHMKAGVLDLGRPVFVAKTNANFPENPATRDLPTIQGTIVLHDAENGYPLALMDSIEISIQRTGAATAVAARYLARADARTVAVAGCGEQGRVQLRSLSRVRDLQRVAVWDVDEGRARALVDELGQELGCPMSVVDDFSTAARAADVCITCTPSTEFLLGKDDVSPGTFVAGVGADNPHKRELEPSLLAAGTLVADIVDQCITIGDLHHAVDAGVLSPADVHAELGAVVAGRAPGRTTDEEITIFDSTGMALQDVATALVVYELAVAAGAGRVIDFGR